MRNKIILALAGQLAIILAVIALAQNLGSPSPSSAFPGSPSPSSASSPPELISYQGRLTNSSGQPLTATVDMTFTFSAAESGSTLYLSILQPSIPVTNGLYNLLIGSGTITPGTESTLASLFQNHSTVFLGLRINSDPELSPRTRIASVPYALQASYAASCDLSSIITAAWNDPDHDHDGYISSLIGGPDCNDANPAVYPLAPEICDGIDNQCPGDPGYGQWDEGCPGGCADADGDGYLNQERCGTVVDCNDNDPNNWQSCATCVDADADTFFAGCDNYVTINGPDCDDADPSIYPGATEILCDGIDQDCDGFDAVSKKLGSDSRITNDPNDSGPSSLSWTGSEFGVSWMQDNGFNYEIYFTRISPIGGKIGTDLRMTSDPAGSWEPSLFWTGSEFGVTWTDYRDGNSEIYFCRLSAIGAKIGADLRVTTDPSYSDGPSLFWTGSEFGVSWEDYRDGKWQIYFSRVSAAGGEIGADFRVTTDPFDSYGPSLSWTGSEFAVSWGENRDGNGEIYFARLSPAGAKIGADLRLTSDPSDSGDGMLSWTGSEFGVSWVDYRDGNWEIYFARFSAAGVKIGSDLRITNDPGISTSPSLFWTGSEFGVSWQDDRAGNDKIYFARVSASGSKIGTDFLVTTDLGWGGASSLAWTGSEFGVSWKDYRHGFGEIYFARIGGCP